MFLVCTAHIWNLTYFFVLIYIYLLLSCYFYAFANIQTSFKIKKINNFNQFYFIINSSIKNIFSVFFLLVFLINYTYSSFSVTAWFGHFVFDNLHFKLFYFILFFFALYLLIFSSTVHFGSSEIIDFCLVILGFFLWTIFLYFSNTLFAIVFLFEILSTLCFLLLLTGIFSSTFFYNNFNFSSNNYFIYFKPNLFLNSILFFFWISLITSLLLFFFLILFYSKFFNFNLNFLEYFVTYFLFNNELYVYFSNMLVWFFFIICIFIKSGLAPFFIWKPFFFKNISILTLAFYIIFFYFFIFNYFILFFLIHVNEIFFSFIIFFNIFLSIGVSALFFLLCETFYIKSFLAVSSILNTFLVFLAISAAPHAVIIV